MRLIQFLNENIELPSFVTYDPNLRYEAQFFSMDDIRVGKKFYNLSKEAQIGVLLHEIGHQLSDELLKTGEAWDWLDAGYYTGDFNGRKVEGLNGKTIPGEVIAEAYSVYHTEPEFLKEHYTELYNVMKPKIEQYNKKLPNEIQRFIKEAT